MNWKDISDNAKGVMQELGNFSPTVNPANVEVKGYLHCDYGDDGRTYWSSDDLRNIANGCIEVADWLDARAAAQIGKDSHDTAGN